MAQSLVTISQLEKKKRKPVSTPDPVPPCKRTMRSMEKKGKIVIIPHTQEDPIDITSPSEDLSVQDDIPSLTEEQATITLCGMREEFEERACIQPATMESTKALTKEQMKKKIWELQKQNQELQQEVKEYQLLDRYIRKENEKLKSTSQQLQDDHEETSNKIKKVLRLLQYVRVIKRELKEETLAINIIDPPK
jgi:predicted RNase H-like nuclease (RuvC/YqgF family)